MEQWCSTISLLPLSVNAILGSVQTEYFQEAQLCNLKFYDEGTLQCKPHFLSVDRFIQ